MADTTFHVTEEGQLMAFLLATLKDKSRTTVKSYLAHSQVQVNAQAQTRFDYRLKAGDTVTVLAGQRVETLRHPLLRMVYEDDELIVVDKQNGLLSIGTDRERTKTAFYILSEYVKRMDLKNRVFVLHRLDRETSGLMMFAKNETIKVQMQSDWDNVVTERKYYAVAEGIFDRSEGIISTYLTDSKGFKVFVSNKAEGERAITEYKVLKQKGNYTLLELSLSTGKKNQIRAHLEYIGHSIIGDKKYGAKTNPIGRVALHAGVLSFVHPVTGQTHTFKTPIPGRFLSLF